MFFKKALLIMLSGLMVLPLVLTGCAGVEEVSAREIANNILLVYPNMNTYKMDMDGGTVMKAKSSNRQMTVYMDIAGTASFNVVTKEMQFIMDFHADIPGQAAEDFSEEIYVVSGEMYLGISGSGVDDWTKVELNTDAWDSQNYLDQQMAFLESALDIDKVGEETVDGIDCYVLAIKPDMTALFNWAMAQQQELFSDMDPSQKDILANMFKDISVKEWVSKGTSLPVRAVTRATIEFSPQDFGADEPGTITMEMRLESTFYDYDVPFTIELPQEALDAKEGSF